MDTSVSVAGLVDLVRLYLILDATGALECHAVEDGEAITGRLLLGRPAPANHALRVEDICVASVAISSLLVSHSYLIFYWLSLIITERVVEVLSFRVYSQ